MDGFEMSIVVKRPIEEAFAVLANLENDANRYEGEMRGFLRLMKPLLISMGRRALQGDFPRLKELMEVHTL